MATFTDKSETKTKRVKKDFSRFIYSAFLKFDLAALRSDEVK